jgi:3-polyprenyl-4-hydroxybenzoate decarboxylase
MDPARDTMLVKNTLINYLDLALPAYSLSNKVGLGESVNQRIDEMRDELGYKPFTTEGSGLFLLHLIISCNSIR